MATAPVKTLAQITDFASLPDYFDKNNVKQAQLVNEGVSVGSHALEVVYESGKWSSWSLAPGELGKAWDWTTLGERGENIAFAIDITNPNDFDFRQIFQFSDYVNDSGYQKRRRDIPANSTHTVYVSLNDLPANLWRNERVKAYGMANLPALYSLENDWEGIDWKLDLDNVYRLRFANGLSYDEDVRIIYDNARIIKDFNHDSAYADLVDRRGQNNQVTHDYKIDPQTDLAELGVAEAAKGVLGHLTGPSRNANGYGSHPSLKPDQNCRLAYADSFNACQDDSGKWYFVDPDGYAFFSSGIANVRLNGTYTLTGVAANGGEDSELRKSMFTEIPTNQDYINDRYKPSAGPVDIGQAVSFFGNNITERHGGERQWRDITQKRLKDWGFNSLGNWAETDFYTEATLPFAVAGWTNNCNGASDCGKYKTIGAGEWGPAIPDPWDSQFKTNVQLMAQEIRNQLDAGGKRHLVLGIYVDNELSWGGKTGQYDNEVLNRHAQTMAVFNTDASQSPAKNTFVGNLLTAEWALNYANIGQLNAAWGTDFASFDAMRAPFNFIDKTGYDGTDTTITGDLNKLQYFIAHNYFKIINDALKEEMPGHLYLGARFADFGRTPSVVTAAKDQVDVISFNIYKETITAEHWDGDQLAQLEAFNLPVIIGEYHFGALDSGSLAEGLLRASNQQERAAKMVRYLESVVANPLFIGAHWFEYIDSPLVGRAWDGENYNIGFVNVTDTPYPEMSDAARRFNCYLYDDSLKTRCETELATPIDNAPVCTSLYTGKNIGVLYRSAETDEPEGSGESCKTSDSKDGGSSSYWLMVFLGLCGLTRRKTYA
ncbi:GlyGly-CTERM sorting domain-containing protein [Vibrio sp. WXL210]|uniref:GlyGly-CTERM sorting domain-containing protein n=1 Tax=Vibrio sp. WXL210 TaxID=3450709 RepID=UPI003EC59DAC